jgi:hypothetical protein
VLTVNRARRAQTGPLARKANPDRKARPVRTAPPGPQVLMVRTVRPDLLVRMVSRSRSRSLPAV